MNSIQDALTEALEHPITELPKRSSTTRRTGKARQAGSNQASDYLFWGVLGSIAGSLLIYGAYRWRNT
jgi:hypothetical protein